MSHGQPNNPKGPMPTDINACIEGMGTPLFYACLSGRPEEVRMLLDEGADPNVRSFVNYPESDLFRPGIPMEVGSLLFENTMAHRSDPRFFHHLDLGITNLYYPALHGERTIVQLLLQAGADPDGASFNGLFPLYVAAEQGYLGIVSDLVEHGADINAVTPKGNTALLNAAEEGEDAVVSYLLEHGADPTVKNQFGVDAAEAAMRCGQNATASLIRSCTPENKPSSGSPDANAILDSLISNLIVESQAPATIALDLNDLKKAIVWQSRNATLGDSGQEVLDALLASHTIKPTSQDDAQLFSSLLVATQSNETVFKFVLGIIKSYILVRSIVEAHTPGVEMAIDAGVNPNMRCLYKGTLHTPVIAAARSGVINICKQVIDAGGNVNQPQSNSETALANAAQLGDLNMVQFLLANGADPNAVTYAGTALAITESLPIAVILIACGADPNIPDKDGDLPIIGSIDQKEYLFTQVLIEHGTDLNRPNKNGTTPLDHANKKGDELIVGMLNHEFSYRPKYSTFIPQNYAESLQQKINGLLQRAYPPEAHQDLYEEQDPETITEAQRNAFSDALALSSKGLTAKRSGDLVEANRLYMEAFSGDIIPRRANIWGWFQVLLVAKNFDDARLILRFYHAVSSSINCIRRDRGEIDKEIEDGFVPECLLTPEFDPLEVLEHCMLISLFDKEAVEEKITSYTGLNPNLKPFYYGGDDPWRRTYKLSDGEYGLFLNSFLFPRMSDGDYLNSPKEDSDNEKGELEAKVAAGDADAHVKLAELIADEDCGRAIDLCEKAIALSDNYDARFLLGKLLMDKDPIRSREQFQILTDAGDYYYSGYLLATLIENEDPDSAIQLYRKAIDDGDTSDAPRRLALLIQDERPDQAIELYEMAIESGNAHAYLDLAFLFSRHHDSERAKSACKKAIEAGDVSYGASLMASLVEEDSIEESIAYNEMAVEAGNYYFAAFALARQLQKNDPDRAKQLYRLSADAGNNNARSSLARLICNDDRQEAINLCEAAIKSEDADDAAFFLAFLIRDNDPERAKELLERCIDHGFRNSNVPNNLGRLIEREDPRRAAELYEQAIELGNTYYATANLAQLIAESQPERAKELYEQSIDAGNVSSYEKLARLLLNTDKDRARELCELGVNAGDTREAAFLLAWLLEETDLERAKRLYQTCIDSGYSWGAGRNLGNLVRDEDPERAAWLYEQALLAGNTEMRVPLAELISDSNKQRAIELCEEAIRDGDDRDAAFRLAYLCADSDPERSKQLYQSLVDKGDYFAAANNLANLIKTDDPDRAVDLYKKSIEAGNHIHAPSNLADLLLNNYHDKEAANIYFEMAIEANSSNASMLNTIGASMMKAERDKAITTFERAIELGDHSYATCNLGHLYFSDNPIKAAEFYRESIANEADDESTEAHIGLSMLEKDAGKAGELIQTAKSRHNYKASIDFMLDYFDEASPPIARKIRDLQQAAKQLPQ